jgi:hypothetical protein
MGTIKTNTARDTIQYTLSLKITALGMSAQFNLLRALECLRYPRKTAATSPTASDITKFTRNQNPTLIDKCKAFTVLNYV